MALHVIKHPLIEHKLTIMRNKNTCPKEFRELLSEITMLLTCEATKDLPLTEVTVETPLQVTRGKIIQGKRLCLIPILRAGLGMVDGALKIMPSVKIGHLGMYRNEETFEPVEYYANMPVGISERTAILLDPMLATGGSAVAAVKYLKKKKVKKIKFIGLVAAPEGIDKMEKACPDVDIYVAALDEKLNKKAYILPGLGDAGDRLYGSF